jgi:predicted pyridoxine 5'-phosphate oxidase superfamily flavin-nucleotide-binding protein
MRARCSPWPPATAPDRTLAQRALAVAPDGGGPQALTMGILTAAMKRVADAELGFIATVCPDGTPNLSPKGTTAVWDDDHLVFADIRSPGTAENLRSNPSIEINVVDQLSRKGYRFKGTAMVHTDGDVFERGVRFYEARGTVRARERIRAIVIVAVERALPVTSPAYDLGAKEDELRELYLGRLNRSAGRS